MNCSPIRTFTLLLLFIALLTTLYEVSKKYPVGKNQKVVTLQSPVVRYTPDDQPLGLQTQFKFIDKGMFSP